MVSCGVVPTPTLPVAYHLCALMLPALPIQHTSREYVYPTMAPFDHHPSWQNRTSSICTGILQVLEIPMDLNVNQPFTTRLVGWLLDPSTVLLE